MISYDQAMAAISSLPPGRLSERRPLAACLGRILAQEARLDGDQPPFDRATMDGYALSPLAGCAGYRVAGTVRAGMPPPRLEPGSAVRIMTGAPCPPGCTVVPSELARESDGVVTCADASLIPGRNIAWRGEDGRAGGRVLEPGIRLTPILLAAAAVCGQRDLEVALPPRLAILTTGNEVGSRSAGGIHDANGPFLDGFSSLLQCPSRREHVADEGGAVLAAVQRLRAQADLIVTTGGVSGSESDLVAAAAATAGFATIFHHVSMQPGKPVLLARHPDGQLLVGLPGNPVSVLATAHVILLPVITRIMGGSSRGWRELPLTTPRPVAPKRRQFLPARLSAAGVEPAAWNGSGDLLAAAAADGLVELPEGRTLQAGDLVRYLPYVGSGDGSRADIQRKGAP